MGGRNGVTDALCCPICHATAKIRFSLGRRHFHTCTNDQCGLIFVSPQPSDEELQEYYTEDYFDPSTAAYALANGAVQRQIIEHLLGQTTEHQPTVLDYGCARGGLWDILPDDLKGRYFGIEPNAAARTDAEERTQRSIFPSIDAFIADAGVKWDICVMNDVIEHIRQPVAELAKLARAGSPAGVLWVATPNPGSIKCWVIGRRWSQYRNRTHLFIFTYASCAQCLSAAGFVGIERPKFRLMYKDVGRLRSLLQIVTRRLAIDGNLTVTARVPRGQ